MPSFKPLSRVVLKESMFFFLKFLHTDDDVECKVMTNVHMVFRMKNKVQPSDREMKMFWTKVKQNSIDLQSYRFTLPSCSQLVSAFWVWIDWKFCVQQNF